MSSVLCSMSAASRWAREGTAHNLKRVAVVCLSKVVAAVVRKLFTKMVEPRGCQGSVCSG